MLCKNEITDGITAGIKERKHRGWEIASFARIDKDRKDGLYIVPSQHNPSQTKYKVGLGDKPRCTCPDHETRGCKCKHIYAVEYSIRRERFPDGFEKVTESVTISKTRKTYPQDWANYNRAQTNEKDQFQKLLHELCKTLDTPQQSMGRKRMPIADAIFCAVFKVYSTVSARRFTSDLGDAQKKGYIAKVPHFNTVLNYLENPEMFGVLNNLIEQAALPLKSVESTFAVDSTGFTACRFVRWYDVKYNRFTAEQQWIKAHLMCGVKTNVVTAIEIKERDAADAPQLPGLVDATAKNFNVREVSADKGYSGRECHNAIDKAGATAYIAFKANATGGVGGLYEKMFHFFQFKREIFLAHYHQRSNIESTMMMIKTKFGDSVRSKTETAARNEVLCKVLCHNICCLISAMYELNIPIDFT